MSQYTEPSLDSLNLTLFLALPSPSHPFTLATGGTPLASPVAIHMVHSSLSLQRISSVRLAPFSVPTSFFFSIYFFASDRLRSALFLLLFAGYGDDFHLLCARSASSALPPDPTPQIVLDLHPFFFAAVRRIWVRPLFASLLLLHSARSSRSISPSFTYHNSCMIQMSI